MVFAALLLLQDPHLQRGRELLAEAERIVPTGEKEVKAQLVKAAVARDELQKADATSPEVWIELSRSHRLEGHWKQAREEIDRAVELEKAPGPARYERGLLPLRYMLHAMPYLNPSAAGALTDRTDVWSLRLSVSRSLKHGWIIADPIGFNDPNDPMLADAEADFADLDEDRRLAGRAVVAYLRRHAAEADYYLRKSIERRPDDPDLLMVAALNGLRVGEYHEALDFADRSLTLQTAQPFGYLLRAALRVIARDDFAGAFEDLRRFAPWIEPSWGRIVEAVATLRTAAIDAPEFKEALTRLADGLLAMTPPSRRSPLPYLYETLKHEPLQDATIAMFKALDERGPDDLDAEMEAFAGAFAGSPLGGLATIVPDTMKTPEGRRQAIGLLAAARALFTADASVEQWDAFKERVEADWAALFGGSPDAELFAIGLAIASNWAAARHLAPPDRMGRFEAILKATESPAVTDRAKSSHVFAAVRAAVRATARIEMGDAAAALAEIQQVFPAAANQWSAVISNAATVLQLASAGQWDAPEFREALSCLAFAPGDETPRPLTALRDPKVVDAWIEVANVVANPDSTDERYVESIRAAIDALQASPWGEDRILGALKDSELLPRMVPILRALAAVPGEKKAAERAGRWEAFLKAWETHEPAISEMARGMDPELRDRWRERDFWPVLTEFVTPLVAFIQAELYHEAGDEEKSRRKFEAVLEFCKNTKVRERIAEDMIPEWLFAAIGAIVHLHLGEPEPAREQLAHFLDEAEALKAEVMERPKSVEALEKILADYRLMKPLLTLVGHKLCDPFERIDLDLGVRWAKLIGVDRSHAIFVQRVRQEIAGKRFDEAKMRLDGATDPAAPLLRVEWLAAQERMREALAACAELRAADPWDDSVYAAEAMLLKQQDRAADAVTLLGALVERNRFHAPAIAERAKLLAGLERFGEARVEVERLFHLNPNSPVADELLATLAGKGGDPGTEQATPWYYAARGDLTGAIADLDRAIELAPRYAHAFEIRARLHAVEAARDAARARELKR